MSGAAVIRALRWRPQTARARLSLLYAALFLGAGTLLLALTYGLVAHSLPTTTPLSKLSAKQQATLAAECKAQPPPPKQSGSPQPRALPASCQTLEKEAANAATSSQRGRTLHALLLYSLLGLGVITIASGGLGWVVAGRVLRPVRLITETARRASDSHLGERLDLDGPNDELKQLADTFDDMLERLDVAFAGQRRFVADASHELRTPLTVMRTAIDVTLAKPDRNSKQLEAMAAKIRRSVDQAEKLIDALLTLAISDQEVLTAEFSDLATIAEDAIDDAAPETHRLGLQTRISLEPAEMSGDRSLLERLVGNLIGNAVRHNVPDGWIEISTGADHDAARIEVSNSGPVVDARLVESLFEPFRRLEARTHRRDGADRADGVGLGLAIVRSITAAHGGVLSATSRPEGGLCITVAFPRRTDTSATVGTPE